MRKFAIQLGACDGKVDVFIGKDRVWKLIVEKGWSGALVEPNPVAFELLSKNYTPYKNRVKLFQIAIGDTEGNVKLYVSADSNLQISSLFPAHLEKHKSIGLPIDVKCKTINQFLHDLNSKKIDLLMIDVEGYDGYIIENIDLEKYKISEIQYEHFHMTQEQRKKCLEKLKEYGYRTLVTKTDTLCFKRKLEYYFKLIKLRIRHFIFYFRS